MPSAKRSSVSVEKTGMRSWSAGERSAATQSALSRPASRAIVAHRSAVEVCNRLDRQVDLVVSVCKREEHRFELARRDIDATVEQMTEERCVPVGVATPCVLEIAHRLIGHEKRRHRADPL